MSQKVIIPHKIKLTALIVAFAFNSSQAIATDCGEVTATGAVITCGNLTESDTRLTVNGGNINITNGIYSGISAISNSTTGITNLAVNDLTLDNNAPMTRIGITASGGITDVTLTGNNVLNHDVSAGGIAVINSFSGDATLTVSGTLTVNNKGNTQAGLDGLEVNSRGTTNTGNATINLLADENSIIEVARGNAVFARTYDDNTAGSVFITIKNAITLNTTGNADVIDGTHGINAETVAGSTGTITVNSAANINTTGISANGINLDNRGSGSVYAYNNGKITTTGDSAHGISARSITGDITINNQEVISATGTNSHAINATTQGNIDISNTASLDAARVGINAAVLAGGSGGITINNTLDTAESIKTIGHAAGTGSPAILAQVLSGNIASGGITINQTGGTLQTMGYDGIGIQAITNAASGDVNITVTDTIMDLKGRNADGVQVSNLNAATSNSDLDINITTNGGEIRTIDPTITATASANYGLVAIQGGIAAGDINIINNGTKITTDLALDGSANNSSAIHARFNESTATGNIFVQNSGELTTKGSDVGTSTIFTINNGSGDTNIINTGHISSGHFDGTTRYGDFNRGIYAESHNGNTTIMNYGDIHTQGAANAGGIYGRSINGGDVSIANIGSNILTEGDVATNNGIEARADKGKASIYVQDSNIQVHGRSGALLAWNGSSTQSSDAEITVVNSTLDSSKGYAHSTIFVNAYDSAKITIDSDSFVHAGADMGYDAGVLTTGTSSGVTLKSLSSELNNFGTIDALSDRAIRSIDIAGAGQSVINNYGTITGYISAEGGSKIDFNNWSSNSLNLRNYYDSDADGIRDTKAVAVSTFGGGNFNNESTGTVRLLAVDNALNTVTTGQYAPTSVHDTNLAGIIQAQLMEVNNFRNSGTIDLTASGKAGDILVISGGAAGTAGTNGNGMYISDGGVLILDTVLNQGGIASQSDMLVIDNAKLAGGATKLYVTNVAGTGAITSDDGIKVVDVLDGAEAGSFELGHIVKGGLYEYTLHQGSLTTLGDNSIYLRATAQQVNPDIGSYLANQTAATGLFMHSLHDRLGEPQYYQNYQQGNSTVPAMWVRAVVSHSKNEAAGGYLKQHSEGTLVHLGGEIANWTSNGNNRYHLGVMGAYGRSETRTTSKATGNKVNSTIDGYGTGAYLTWYSDPSSVEGWYSDIWSMYNWFENKTEGSDDYDSQSWTTSVEVGYATKLSTLENYHWMLEPQAQVAYNYYSVDDIKDHNGLTISDSDADGIATRLGMRTYLRPANHKNGAQPFFEVNWLYNSAKNSMIFNGETISDDTPKNRFEAKVGVQGEMTQDLQVYSHIGLQWGKDNYESAEGQVGLRYHF